MTTNPDFGKNPGEWTPQAKAALLAMLLRYRVLTVDALLGTISTPIHDYWQDPEYKAAWAVKDTLAPWTKNAAFAIPEDVIAAERKHHGIPDEVPN